MKTLLACTTVICFALAGCGDLRDSMNAAPDRRGHAAVSATNPSQTGSLSGAAVATDKEMYITLGSQDSLSSVAKAYNVSLEWLIKRNRLSAPAKPGQNIIVPKR